MIIKYAGGLFIQFLLIIIVKCDSDGEGIRSNRFEKLKTLRKHEESKIELKGEKIFTKSNNSNRQLGPGPLGTTLFAMTFDIFVNTVLTDKPSIAPSDSPLTPPSSKPTDSDRPSKAPSATPSARPSSPPTTSSPPSAKPSARPTTTEMPSDAPSCSGGFWRYLYLFTSGIDEIMGSFFIDYVD